MYMLLLICVVWAALFLILTIIFDVWVYLDTKDFNFVLGVWMKRHGAPDAHLSPEQAAMLKAISLIERSLGYFGLFVVVPLYAFLIFTGAHNG